MDSGNPYLNNFYKKEQMYQIVYGARGGYEKPKDNNSG
jgi:hypothetical protein